MKEGSKNRLWASVFTQSVCKISSEPEPVEEINFHSNTSLDGYDSHVNELRKHYKNFDITSAVADLETVRDLYRYTISLYTANQLSYGHSTSNAWEDALFLILHLLNLPYQDPIEVWGSCKLLKEERELILKYVKKRIETRKPTAYLLNCCYQQGECFYIDERVLVPRSYIGEILLSPKYSIVKGVYSKVSEDKDDSGNSFEFGKGELGYNDYFIDYDNDNDINNTDNNNNNSADVRPVIDPDQVHTVMDMCTGSGALAILASRVFPNAHTIDAVDISKEALEVATININEKDLHDYIGTLQSDLFQNLPTTLKYDLILCNPPYVDAESMWQLPTEYTKEPSIALDGGDDGVDLIRRLLNDAHHYLNDNGAIICEVGIQKETILETFPHLEFYWLDTESSSQEVFYITKESLMINEK